MTTSNNTTLLGYLAVDQFGHSVHLTEPKHPRKQLLKELGYASADKMYIDAEFDESKHVGYIVGDRWFNIHEVHAWNH